MMRQIERPRVSLRSMAIALILAAVLLYLALQGVSWEQVLTAIANASMAHLVAAWLVLSFSYVLRALRWRVLLSATRLISSLDACWATAAGYLGNNFLPARAGEILRTVLLGRRTGISKSYILATALTERLMDAVALVLLSLAALATLAGIPDWVRQASYLMAVAGLVGTALLFALPHLEAVLKRLIARVLPAGRLRERINEFLEQFLLGMAALQHTGRALKFWALTVLIWLADAAIAILIAQSIGLSLSLPQSLLLLAALGFASAAPSTPGYLGVYQYVAVTVLVPFGFSQSQALAYIILFQAVSYAVVTIWGLLGLWRLSLRASPEAPVAASAQRS